MIIVNGRVTGKYGLDVVDRDEEREIVLERCIEIDAVNGKRSVEELNSQVLVDGKAIPGC